MFAKLPDLLGKNFVIGYLLPSFALITINYFINGVYGWLPSNISFQYLAKLSVTEQITLIAIYSFIAGIFLLIFNSNIIRFMMGTEFGIMNPFCLLHKRQKKRFKTLIDDLKSVEKEYWKHSDGNKTVPLEIEQKRAKLLKQKSINFPDSIELVLPTSFGNAIRAYESYSRIMYGADAIPIWTRLLSVIPENYWQFIDTVKTKMDFWVNIWFVSVSVLLVYIGNIIYYRQLQLPWFPIFCLSAAWFSFDRAKQSAISWGNFIKASFDLFLGDLEEKLYFFKENSETNNTDIVWQRFSQAVLYNNPESMQEEE